MLLKINSKRKKSFCNIQEIDDKYELIRILSRQQETSDRLKMFMTKNDNL